MLSDASSEELSQSTKRKEKSKFKNMGYKLVHSKHMLWGVGLASFLESIIVPIPLEAILIPLMQARRSAIIAISTVALLGCILGASVGYAVGYFIFDAIGDELISLLSNQEQYEQVKQQMESKGFWFVFSVGVTPIPFQIAMLAAGATKYAFGSFIAASCLSRAVRYFGLGGLVWLFGNKAQAIFEKHKVVAAISVVLIIALIWWIVI